MVPKPDDPTLTASDEGKSLAEQLYGPYPNAIPVPFLTVENEGREGQTPPEEDVKKAKTMFDMPCKCIFSR